MTSPTRARFPTRSDATRIHTLHCVRDRGARAQVSDARPGFAGTGQECADAGDAISGG
ncbi:hypothetical protein GCM10009816_11130 [Microbacterium aquimaris]